MQQSAPRQLTRHLSPTTLPIIDTLFNATAALASAPKHASSTRTLRAANLAQPTMPSPPSSPPTARYDSPHRGPVPGGFDYHEQSSPTKYAVDARSADANDHPDSFSLPPLPSDDSTLLHAPSDDGIGRSEGESETINERETRRKLMDIESSFLPTHSPLGHGGGADDASVLAGPHGAMAPPPHPSTYRQAQPSNPTHHTDLAALPEEHERSQSPPTPPETYRTPAPPSEPSPPRGQSPRADQVELRSNISSLETMSSSPTAAAAARTVHRVVSQASVGGYETADDRSPERRERRPSAADSDGPEDGEKTPRKPKDVGRASGTATADRPELSIHQKAAPMAANTTRSEPSTVRERPKQLRTRYSSQRLSASSIATSVSSKDGASDVTLGPTHLHPTDGGAAIDDPVGRSELSRSTSLGSIASGITGFEDSANSWDRGRTVSGTSVLAGSTSGAAERNLSRLDEENDPNAASDPKTPKATGRNLTAPTDTVIAQHVRDIQVPASVAREYRQNNRPASPDKRAGMPVPPHGRGKGLTLKEQSSSIDRLQKENFDLKLKIHYLNQALNERSEEGVKEMISENVELKASLATMEKQSRNLRKTIRDLERAQKEREGQTAAAGNGEGAANDKGANQAPAPEAIREMEEEINFLRERVETYEYEIDKMRGEELSRESEKRRLAEVVRSMGERKGLDSDIGAREEMVRALCLCVVHIR